MTNSSFEEKSLPQKISEDIIALILEENLQPGDKLPNETILSERLNAGRSSIREAMKLLASRNMALLLSVTSKSSLMICWKFVFFWNHPLQQWQPLTQMKKT